MSLGVLTLYLLLPGCTSLKEKRGRLKPVIARLRREFNVSVAEVDRQDMWQEAVVACALVSNEQTFTQRVLQEVIAYTEKAWPDMNIMDQRIELL